VLGIDTPSVDGLVTKFTKYMPCASDDMFPSYIAAHPFPTLTPDTYATTAPPVVVIHGKATRADDDANVSQRNLVLHRVCSIHALDEPHILPDKRTLAAEDRLPFMSIICGATRPFYLDT
jgi:hypothetical protein